MRARLERHVCRRTLCLITSRAKREHLCVRLPRLGVVSFSDDILCFFIHEHTSNHGVRKRELFISHGCQLKRTAHVMTVTRGDVISDCIQLLIIITDQR